MARVLVGQQIIGSILAKGTARDYTDKGWTLDWVTDRANPEYAALFRGSEADIYAYILKHQTEHGQVPTLSLLEYEFGEVKLPVEQLLVSEVLEIADRQLGQVQLAWNDQEILQLREAGEVQEAAQLMLESAQKVLRSAERQGQRDIFDRADRDVDTFLSRRYSRGPGFGISELDENWIGSQRGELIALIGRAKANKSTHLLAAAYSAWMGVDRMGGRGSVDPLRVLFITFEMNIESINARLMCYGTGVNPAKFIRPVEDDPPSPDDVRKVKEFWNNRVRPDDSQSLQIVQPNGRYTVTDLAMDIESFEADSVYLDGFYFLTDERTGYTGMHPTGHDNLAGDLKSLAMRTNISLWVTHQFREKQLGKAGGGIKDDSAMASGTGLRMACDALFTFDKNEEGEATITNTANRNPTLPTVKGEWDWPNYRFNAYVDETWEETEE